MTETMREALIVTFPVPRFKSFVPKNVIGPFQLCALVVARVMARPLVLFMVPPVVRSGPLPRAYSWLILSVPLELRVVPPAKVLLPASVAVPVETVRVELPPAISPVDVWLSVPPFMVTFDPFKLPERARVPADIVVAPV